MTTKDGVIGKIRPLILVGGLGTRLKPRTNYLPKPLLPVDGRPILWYALNALLGYKMLPPKVTTGYKGDLIRTFFERDNAQFCELPGRTMAEAVLNVAEDDSADAFLGMSSDVLVPRNAVQEILNDYCENGRRDTLLFVRLPKVGHKKWEFCVENGRLYDIIAKDSQTNFEKVLLLLNKKSLQEVRTLLGRPVADDTIPEEVKGFQTGWILILKSMILAGIDVFARVVDIPVCNINVPTDFVQAEEFVKQQIGRWLSAEA